MLNVVWVLMLLSSVIYSFFCGSVKAVTDAMLQSCSDAISFTLKTGAVMIMWSGLMNIAEKSALTERIAAFLSPVISTIFQKVKRGSSEAKLICANMSANMLGLSNAATPLGIAAMKKLSEQSRGRRATNDMCMLAVVNCSSVQLIPSTLIAMRTAYGSSAPGDITVPIWITSALTLVFAVVITKIAERRSSND